MPNSYVVLLVNEWGQLLERDGTLYLSNSGRPHFQQAFSDLALARKFADEVVSELPNVECDVVCGDEIVSQHFNAEWRRVESEEVLRISFLQRQQNRRTISAIMGVVIMTILGALVYFSYGRADD